MLILDLQLGAAVWIGFVSRRRACWFVTSNSVPQSGLASFHAEARKIRALRLVGSIKPIGFVHRGRSCRIAVSLTSLIPHARATTHPRARRASNQTNT